MTEENRPTIAPARQIERQSESMIAENNTISLLNRSEIDMQIATAHQYPRSLKTFLSEALSMATLNESVAEECFYAIPRDGKTVEGPSARLAEIVASAWGNCRAGARVVSEDGDFVTAQGVFHDLERNVAITFEVKRRITNKSGRKFNADMIAVTGNAASSIALRNAILKGVPKAFWSNIYEEVRKVAMGTAQTIVNRRARAFSVLQKFNIKPEQVFALLGISGEEDMTPEMLLTLHGLVTAMKDGDTTPEEAFPPIRPTGFFNAPKSAAVNHDPATGEVIKYQDPVPQDAPPQPQQEDPPPASESDYGHAEPEPEKAKAAPKKDAKVIRIVDATGSGYKAPDVGHASAVLCEWLGKCDSVDAVHILMDNNSDVINGMPSSIRRTVEQEAQQREASFQPVATEAKAEETPQEKPKGWDW